MVDLTTLQAELAERDECEMIVAQIEHTFGASRKRLPDVARDVMHRACDKDRLIMELQSIAESVVCGVDKVTAEPPLAFARLEANLTAAESALAKLQAERDAAVAERDQLLVHGSVRERHALLQRAEAAESQLAAIREQQAKLVGALEWIARIPCRETPPCSSRMDYACDSCTARTALTTASEILNERGRGMSKAATIKHRWPEGLEQCVFYEVLCDDKGRNGGSYLRVMVAQDGDVYVSMQDWEEIPDGAPSAFPSIRIRTLAGGGRNLRTRQALIELANAIRLDTADANERRGLAPTLEKTP